MESEATDGSLISTIGLTKHYGAHPALVDANISVSPGTIFGFLGPNGAGKTTLIRLLMGFIKPSSGHAKLFGFDSWSDGMRARQEIGYLVPSSGLYPDLSGADQLEYAARLSGKRPVNRKPVLDALELSDAALTRKLGTYSKGMRQKLALTAAMQTDPPLLILDEPTDGLDPLIQRNFEDLLRSMQKRGRTVFMSSHDLAEVERTCERVAVIRSGRIVTEELIEDMQKRHASRVTICFHDAIPDRIGELPGISITERRERQVELLATGDPNPLLQFVAGHVVDDITIERASLEDIFMTFYEAGT